MENDSFGDFEQIAFDDSHARNPTPPDSGVTEWIPSDFDHGKEKGRRSCPRRPTNHSMNHRPLTVKRPVRQQDFTNRGPLVPKLSMLYRPNRAGDQVDVMARSHDRQSSIAGPRRGDTTAPVAIPGALICLPELHNGCRVARLMGSVKRWMPLRFLCSGVDSFP